MSSKNENINENINETSKDPLENEDVVKNMPEEKLIEVKKEDIYVEENKESEIKELNENKDDGIKIVRKKDADKKKRIRLTIILVSAFLLSLIILFGIIVCINKLSKNVYKNVYLSDVDMSGKTSEEVIEILNAQEKMISEKKMDIYQDTESIYNFVPEDIDFKLDVATTAKKIVDFGRKENLFKNNFKIFSALFRKVEIEPEYIYDNEKLDTLIKNIDLTIKDRFVEDSFNIDEENKKLIITRGKTGNSIDYNNEKENIINGMSKADNNKVILNIIKKSPTQIDLSKVYEEVKRDAKDAYVDESTKPIKFVTEIIGLDFNIEELKNILSQEENKNEGKVIEYPLIITEPKVKIADITYNFYKDKLSGKTTYFDASQSARANNLNIALKYLNGKVIMPGETFSYNQAIGQTSVSKGYQAAATFKGGTVVMELGGGICQTTSTLYNTALMANLEIVQRHQHGLPVGYVQPSLDATVYSPVLDFKFKNNRNYPVKIVTSFSYSGSMNVSIYGTKEENEYDISLSSKYISTIPFTTKYVYDNALPSGEQVIDAKGVNGYVSEGYITKSQNGKVVESKMLSRDTYKSQQQVVRVGTNQSAS